MCQESEEGEFLEFFSLLFSADENLIELINKQLNHNTVNAGLQAALSFQECLLQIRNTTYLPKNLENMPQICQKIAIHQKYVSTYIIYTFSKAG